MCPPGHYNSGFVRTHALGQMMRNYQSHDVTIHHAPKPMSSHKAIMVITRRVHYFHS